MPSDEVRKRRAIWIPVGLVLLSLGLSSMTGVAFLDILKPFSALTAVGMFFGWVAYEVTDFNPYEY